MFPGGRREGHNASGSDYSGVVLWGFDCFEGSTHTKMCSRSYEPWSNIICIPARVCIYLVHDKTIDSQSTLVHSSLHLHCGNFPPRILPGGSGKVKHGTVLFCSLLNLGQARAKQGFYIRMLCTVCYVPLGPI